MKSKFVVLVVGLMLSGCISGLNTSTGSKTTSYVGEDGKVNRQVVEDVSLSDVAEHYKAVKGVVDAVGTATAAQASSIASMANDSAKKAESSEAAGLYKAIGMFSIAQLRPNYAAPLAALGKRPMGIIEGGVEILKFGVGAAVGISQAKYAKETIAIVADKAGTSIVSSISGDNNNSSVTNKDTKVSTQTHNNTIGDNSPATTNNSQQALGCPTGDCGDDEGEFKEFECKTNADCAGDENGSICNEEHQCVEPEEQMCTGPRGTVPVDHIGPDGEPWVTPLCSCGSFQAGHCDV